MIETSACTLAHRTFGYALCYAFCDDRPWKSMEHGALLSCKHRLKHHFNKHLWQIKIKTSDKPRIHKLSIRLPKCKLCAMQRCNCLQFLLSLLQKTRMDLRWYVPEETVRIGRCKAASRRRFFFFWGGEGCHKVELEYIMMEWWWNDWNFVFFFSFEAHVFFCIRSLYFIDVFIIFIEVLHRVLEPHFSMLHTKAQALATKVAFWRRDLCLLCAGGLAARDRQEIAMVCYCYCYKMTYYD